MNSRKALALVAVLGFLAFLLWSTLSSQRFECAVSVDFRGRGGSATASGASQESATREAQTAACGPITGSMDDRIACANRPPVSRHCQPL
ncbi:MAG: hypothetical protein ACREL3_07335 [Gemmatimonadales bacterium]